MNRYKLEDTNKDWPPEVIEADSAIDALEKVTLSRDWKITDQGRTWLATHEQMAAIVISKPDTRYKNHKMTAHIEMEVTATEFMTFDDIVAAIQKRTATEGPGDGIIVTMDPSETVIEDEDTVTRMWERKF